jgi:hypothetical protein
MTLGVPNYFTPGQFPIDSDQVNANFQAIVDYVNGLSIPTTPVSIANGGTGSTTPSAALTALGLASGTIIPGTVAYSTSGSNGTLTFTGSSAAPAVSDYALGNFYAFQVPVGTTAAPSNLYFIDATTAGSGLGALQVYDNPGFSPTGTLISDQIMVLAFEPVADTFVLLNPPPVANTLRFAYYTSGSNTLTVPPGVSTMYATGAGPGGGGGACQGGSGGGGGGGGASGIGVPFSVTAGHTLVVNIGAGGAGGTSGAGSNSGTTTIVDISTSTTLISWAGGQGGGSTSGTSAVSGGTGGTPVGGGTAGSSGQSGDYYATAPLSYGGAGGSSLLTTGASSTASGGGQTNTGITSIGAGAGGSGGAGSSANGGAGGPGLMHLQW